MDDDFVNLIGYIEIDRRLVVPARRLNPGSRIGASSYPELASLRVLEVKQVSQDLADRWGGALTSTFLGAWTILARNWGAADRPDLHEPGG